ncbi:MAG: exodeoxyribonuclease V subunit beta [Desulfuromonadaceae bacterium]|nr:exodeoxyribonuclease V subunit beta [Desulfuromonadaceae bacterium]
MKPLNLASIDISGFNLIEASAGTGKTWSIAALYILLLLEKELRPEQILVVTYTKAATAELRERIRQRIASTLDLYSNRRPPGNDDLERLLMSTRTQNGERAKLLLKRALYSFDNAAIFTIHGFCQRALLENTFESGSLIGSDMISDQNALIKMACDDFWRSHMLPQSDDFTEILVNRGYTPEKLVKPLKGHLQNPDLIIVPPAEEVPLTPLILDRDKLYNQLCTLWNSQRSSIVEMIDQARLNQQSYKPAQIISAAASFDIWVSGGSASLPNSKLDFFSAGKIASKTTKTSIFTPEHLFFDLCQQLSEVLNSIDQAFTNTIYSCQHDLKQWLEQELSRRKKKLNIRSFDDLLLDLHCALEADTGPALVEKLRQRYKAAMIDEFQDTDPVQWNIFKHLAADPDYPLFLIGDPKQAIYSFRGADVYAYLKAGKKVSSDKSHSLGTNFRSDAALVHAVTSLFNAASDPFLCPDITFQSVESGRLKEDGFLFDGVRDENPFKVWVYPRNDETKAELKPSATHNIVLSVAAEISRLLEPERGIILTTGVRRKLEPGDIAVLVKTHTQADHVQKALLSLGIPSVQQGSATIFETSEALDLLIILRAVAEPHREALIREALLTPTMGLSANQVSCYVESGGEHPDWEMWLLNFWNLHSVAQSGGVVALISRLLGSCGVRMHALSRVGGERSLTNILHCCEMLHQIEREQGKELSGLITWLERSLTVSVRDDTALLRLETDNNAVMIATIHASKGLQYPIVFVPFAWDAPSKKVDRALFHDEEGNLILDLANRADSLQQASAERKAEAARLLYVALTRAEFRCYAIWGAIGGAADSPLFQLLHGGSSSINVNTFSALGDHTILDDISRQSIVTRNGICAEMMPTDQPDVLFQAATDDAAPYTCRSLSHAICDDWHVASFSGMTSGAGHVLEPFEPHDRDSLRVTGTVPVDAEPSSGGLTIFDFPKGTKAGICLHEIFELLDYSQLNNDVLATTVGSSLARHGFHEQWLPSVTRMVVDVTSAGIIGNDPGFSLSKLQPKEMQTEMEFYLPVKHLEPDTLKTLFAGMLDEKQCHDFYELLDSLSFRQSRGMLQGFIDLVFTHNGRYYLLDWKSNHLGMKTSDYDQKAMHDSMCRSAYILQYHLYALALDRLLKMRLPDYRYEKHFGGVIYLYVRGVSADSTVNGIYYERPLPEFIPRAGEIMLA